MFDDQFYKIYLGEIFVKSRCMEHESAVMNFFRSCLSNLGYVTQDPAQRIWHRQQKKVIVCFADDFNVCGAQLEKSPAHWFDSETVVITDNHIVVPTQYQVCQAPDSYLGVFSYDPESSEYDPDRRFNFSVNRLDTQRQLICLELACQSGGLDTLQRQDYLNFNAWDAQGNNDTKQHIENNFKQHWSQIQQWYQNRYNTLVDDLARAVPIKNHEYSVELASYKSWLTPVIETYSGNVTMAFSEKIFRALQTPVPWTVYSTTGAVKHLQTLGFDVLDDMVNHDYNSVRQDSPHGINKISAFIKASTENVQRLRQLDLNTIRSRCQQAANHNQQLLAAMRQRWPQDFAIWLPTVIEKIL